LLNDEKKTTTLNLHLENRRHVVNASADAKLHFYKSLKLPASSAVNSTILCISLLSFLGE